MEFIRRRDKTKKLHGNHMKANIEENTILMSLKIKATSHYARKYCSFDYHIEYSQIRIVS